MLGLGHIVNLSMFYSDISEPSGGTKAEVSLMTHRSPPSEALSGWPGVYLIISVGLKNKSLAILMHESIYSFKTYFKGSCNIFSYDFPSLGNYISRS